MPGSSGCSWQFPELGLGHSMSRRTFGGSMMLAAVGSLAACGVKGGPKGASGASGDTYIMGEKIIPSQMANINPFQITGNWANLFRYLYDSLFYFDPVDGQLTTELAQHGSWNADHTVYTAKLNPKAQWHDNKAVTADDVVFTFDVLKKYPQTDKFAIWQQLKSVTGKGSTVDFTVSQPYQGLPSLLSQIYIVPKHVWSGFANPTSVANNKPIGSGPFKFSSYQNGVAINLARNTAYFLGAPHLNLQIIMYSDASPLTEALDKGTIQTTTGTIAMPSLPELLKTKTNKFQMYAGLSLYGVLLNNTRPGLDDVNVRRAIQRAIDQKSLIQKGELGGAVRENPGWLAPLFKQYVDQDIYNDPQYQYNPDAAKALLKSSGYTINGGVAEKDGKQLSFTYYVESGAPAQEKEASLIRGWLTAIGIKTTLRVATGPEMTQLASEGNYDLLQTGINVPPDPVASMSSVFGSQFTAPVGKPTPGLNYVRYKNPELDQILAQASQTFSTPQLKKLLSQAQKIVADDAPLAIMYDSGGHLVYRTDVYTGYNTNYPVWSPDSLDGVTIVGK